MLASLVGALVVLTSGSACSNKENAAGADSSYRAVTTSATSASASAPPPPGAISDLTPVEPSSTPFPDRGMSDSARSVPTGFVRHAGNGMVLDAPKRWRLVKVHRGGAGTGDGDLPAGVSDELQAGLRRLPTGSELSVIFAPEPSTRRGFVTNVTITRVPVGGFTTVGSLEQLARLSAAEAKGKQVTVREVQLGRHKGIVSTYVVATQESGRLTQRQYYLAGESPYVYTVSLTTDQFRDYRASFDAIGRSFRLSED